MKMNRIQLAILAGACSAFGTSAQAQALTLDPSWSFSGFGTLAYTAIDTDDAQFVSPGQPMGAGKEGSIAPDSKIGAQLTGKVNSVFSATAQLLAKRNGEGKAKPEFEWAFIKAQATPELSFRAGRIGAPLFAVSDYRDVGYSNLWVRPPLEVYGQVPISHFEGADAIYAHTFGNTTVTGQLWGGTSTAWDDDTRVHVRHLIGLNVTAELDDGITLRAGTAKGKLTADSDNIAMLAGALGQTPFASVGQQLVANGQSATFSGIGIAVDQGNWVGNFEYTWRRTDSYVPDTNGWELTGGYRVGKFTPFVQVSKVKIVSSNVDASGLNAAATQVPQLLPLAGGVAAVLGADAVAIGQRDAAIGVRWDVWKNIALKAQFDHVTPDHDPGLFVATKNGFGNSAVNVYAVSADFVF